MHLVSDEKLGTCLLGELLSRYCKQSHTKGSVTGRTCPNDFLILNVYPRDMFSAFIIFSFLSLFKELWEIDEHIAAFPQEGFMFQISIITLTWPDTQKSSLLVSLLNQQ